MRDTAEAEETIEAENILEDIPKGFFEGDSVAEDFPKEFLGDFPEFPTFSRRLPLGLHFLLDFPN